MELRQYQNTLVDRVRAAIAKGYRRILVVAPTGSGKTVIASHLMSLAETKRKSSIFLAHRREIILQTSDKLVNFGCPHGVLMAGSRPSIHQRVQVGSIQTVNSRYINSDRMKPECDVLFFDEAHRSLAVTYQRVLEEYNDCVLIGLTATPCRADGKGLGAMYDIMIEATTVAELIELGYLVEPKVYAPSMPDLRGVGTSQGDYIKTELEAAMDQGILVGNVVDNWKENFDGRKTVVFASGVQHSMHLNERFLAAGYRSAHIDGTTDKGKRDEILHALEAGDLQVVTNCDVLLEGWDCPPVSCAILARPTKSYGLYLQMAGRILRPHEGKSDGVLIDHAGAVYRHGFVQDAGNWSLDPDTPIQERRKLSEDDAVEKQPTTCRECFAVYEGQHHCPNCGWVPTRQAKDVNFAEGRLREVKRKKKKVDERQKLWDSCMWRCIKSGRKIGVAAHMYKTKMGVFPTGLTNLPKNKAEWNMVAKEFYEYAKQNH